MATGESLTVEEWEALELLDKDVYLPPPEPQAPAIADCLDPQEPVGYSSLPPNLRSVALPRKTYKTLSEAEERYEQLKELRQLTTIDGPWWTMQHWIWRVV